MGTENLSSILNFSVLNGGTTPIAFNTSKKEAPGDQDFSAQKIQSTNSNAAQLGIYTLDQIKQKGLQALQLKDFAPITQGNYKDGQYTSRVLYLEGGNISQSLGGNLGGNYIVNNQFQIKGQPSLSSQNSSTGQFPVNGQYFLQGLYRDQLNLSSNQVYNGQYATSSQDNINQQFTVSGLVSAKGDVLEGGPFFITKSELLNGRYQLQVQSLKGSVLQVNNQTIQIGASKTEQGQLLVNGINAVQGLIRPLNQFTQQATLFINGSYDSNGKYVINGVTLENGSNSITSNYSIGSAQGNSTAVINGRYTSGGQFVVSQSGAVTSTPSNKSNQSNFELIQKQLQDTFNALSHPLPGRILKLNG
ncbi:MAG: hypothetical protein V4507_16905 [Verrucomicrobiota bacterium]